MIAWICLHPVLFALIVLVLLVVIAAVLVVSWVASAFVQLLDIVFTGLGSIFD